MRISRLLSFVCILCLLSCGKEEYSDIPSTPVNITLYLGDKDKELNAILAHKIITKNDINTSQREYAGFGGVLVYHHSNGTFQAFDIACPYEIKANTTIKVDPEGITATCPKCGSKFDLESFGGPISGPSVDNPGRKRLRPYIASQSGNIIRITN